MLCKVTHDTGHTSTNTKPRALVVLAWGDLEMDCYNKKGGWWALQLIPGLVSLVVLTVVTRRWDNYSTQDGQLASG